MYYFLYGKDSDKARAKAEELVQSMHQKKPDAELFKLDTDNWKESQFDEFVRAQGLFERKFIVFANRLFEKKEIKEVVLEKLSEIGKSDNVFIFLEGALDKASLKLVEASAQRVQVFEKEKTNDRYEPGGEAFNTFALADAFGERNKKLLWVLYQKSVRAEGSPEELAGILFWQLKNIMLAQACATATEAGVTPFVFSKSKRFSKNFTEGELAKLASQLIDLYHNAHRGKVDFEAGLEGFLLSL